MTKKRTSLTTEIISKAGPRRPNAPTLLCDGNGLYLQITPAGVRSWIFRYTIKRRTRSMGLGPLRFLGLKEARKRALELSLRVSQGDDPLETAKSKNEEAETSGTGSSLLEYLPAPATGAPTFRECAASYVRRRAATLKSKKHVAQWFSTLEQYAYPAFGDRPISAIGVQDVVAVLEPIWFRIPETAARLRGRIEKVFTYAAVMGYREKAAGNPAAWSGHLSEVLPARSRVRAVKHHSSLPYQELPRFFERLRGDGSMGSLLLQFLTLTMTRTGEARGATWSEVDFEQRLWTIPRERMKGGKEHRVPLSAPALAILEHQRQNNLALQVQSKFVFPGREPTQSVSNTAALELLKRIGRRDVTPHGMRSTARVFAAEQTNFPREVCEAALAHKLADRVEAAYQRSDLLEKRRELMDTWGRYCISGARLR